MAAKNMGAARRTPLIAAVPKMIFPVLVILPGMIAAALAVSHKDGYRLPPKPLDAAIYEKCCPPSSQASAAGLQGRAAFQAVNKCLGPADANTYKLDRKNCALVADNKSAALPRKALKSRCRTPWGKRITTGSSFRW